jgi:hypothetical protein
MRAFCRSGYDTELGPLGLEARDNNWHAEQSIRANCRSIGAHIGSQFLNQPLRLPACCKRSAGDSPALLLNVADSPALLLNVGDSPALLLNVGESPTLL